MDGGGASAPASGRVHSFKPLIFRVAGRRVSHVFSGFGVGDAHHRKAHTNHQPRTTNPTHGCPIVRGFRTVGVFTTGEPHPLDKSCLLAICASTHCDIKTSRLAQIRRRVVACGNLRRGNCLPPRAQRAASALENAVSYIQVGLRTDPHADRKIAAILRQAKVAH
jgi:hypothetical protein